MFGLLTITFVLLAIGDSGGTENITKAGGYVNWVWPNGAGEDEAGYLDLFERGANGINASAPAAGVAALNTYLDQLEE